MEIIRSKKWKLIREVSRKVDPVDWDGLDRSLYEEKLGDRERAVNFEDIKENESFELYNIARDSEESRNLTGVNRKLFKRS